MSLVFIYTLNDYVEDPVNINPTTSGKNNVFPAISVCITKNNYQSVSTERIEKYVKKYYAENNIEEPKA